MKASHKPRASRGLTLIELMVALAVGLIVVLAASTVYLATKDTSRASQSFSDISDTGALAMDIIGRELQKAGFYPAQLPTDATSGNRIGAYTNIKGPAVFGFGLYGCDNRPYDPSTRACSTAAAAASAPDGLIVNYFSTPEFGSSNTLIGNSNDCNRAPVSADASNTARAAAGLPLIVSNRFSVVESTVVAPDGSSKLQRSLACHGNGNESAAAAAPLLDGVYDMALLYGVYATGGTSQSPTKFYTATQVDGLGANPWSRVTAVKVCFVVQSLETTRQTDGSGTARLKPSCHGPAAAQPATDRYVYKRFEQIFAIRNNLSDSL